MNEQMRPMTLGEVLDRTAQLYRSRFLVYFGIAVIPAATVLLFAGGSVALMTWFGAITPRGSVPASSTILAIVLLMVCGFVAVPVCFGTTALGWAAMNHAAARAFFGETITIREAYRNAWAHKWKYLWLCILLALIVAVGPATILVLVSSISAGFAALARSSGLGSLAGFLLGGFIFLVVAGLMAYALWMLLRVCLAFPASVVEQISAWDAVKRGGLLSKGTKGRIFLLFLLGTALSWLLAMGISVPALIVIALIPGATSPQHAQTFSVVFVVLWYGLWFVVQALTKPVYGIALTLFYFDQRVRTEGFDIECMMRNAGMVPEPQTPPQLAPWFPPAMPEVAITATPKDAVSGPSTAPELQPELPKAGDPA